MGRRRKISIKKRTRRRQPKDRSTTARKRMLDMGNISGFKYRLRKTLEEVEGGETIFANVKSKSVNIGTEEAKKYVEDTVNQGSLKREKADEIIELLKRYTKLR